MTLLSTTLLLLSLLLPGSLRAGGPPQEIRFGFEPALVSVPVGGQARLQLNLALLVPGAYIHGHAPFKIKLSGDGWARNELGRKDGKVTGGSGDAATAISFPVEWTGRSAGKTTVKASIDFFYCTAAVCLRKTAEATAEIATP